MHSFSHVALLQEPRSPNAIALLLQLEPENGQAWNEKLDNSKAMLSFSLQLALLVPFAKRLEEKAIAFDPALNRQGCSDEGE